MGCREVPDFSAPSALYLLQQRKPSTFRSFPLYAVTGGNLVSHQAQIGLGISNLKRYDCPCSTVFWQWWASPMSGGSESTRVCGNSKGGFQILLAALRA
ncbi:hypothetical protein MRB53_035462 [Persea americana]|uniref:Uncharacterized protein n=1 Tax=Persea americana TaxID=3435 RepID=A0ACC2K4P5_PERAE|nr:hypothetical protein MRB53_035462 [Persea americana]